jgi:hypothetical protein
VSSFISLSSLKIVKEKVVQKLINSNQRGQIIKYKNKQLLLFKCMMHNITCAERKEVHDA